MDNVMVLMPGDVLLYSSNGFFPLLIKLKTWSTISHTETYLGEGWSAGARSKGGVGTFQLRLDGLVRVLRPKVLPDFEAGIQWHLSCEGQGYDYWGLLRAFLSPKGRGHGNKMWCSEHSARMAKKSGYFPFGNFDSEKVSPSMFLVSTAYDHYLPDGSPVPEQGN